MYYCSQTLKKPCFNWLISRQRHKIPSSSNMYFIEIENIADNNQEGSSDMTTGIYILSVNHLSPTIIPALIESSSTVMEICHRLLAHTNKHDLKRYRSICLVFHNGTNFCVPAELVNSTEHGYFLSVVIFVRLLVFGTSHILMWLETFKLLKVGKSGFNH